VRGSIHIEESAVYIHRSLGTLHLNCLYLSKENKTITAPSKVLCKVTRRRPNRLLYIFHLL